MKRTRLKIKKLHFNAIIPSYQTPQSAGFDLHALESCVLKAGERILVGTGLAFEVDSGFEIQVRPRSGLALKNGISVLNTPGTIDSDYRGEIKVILINHSREDFHIKEGDRIAQAVINEVIYADFEEAEELSESVRGEGSFGSSGVAKDK
ncbi:dUTP diphosphatase [Helicobacter mastomyrinus]|uniref:Deoxyuridine 5'-triphosphate nucleotidohydrolase n=2 Tax=Helicobacter TaxID=209 RepID=A0ABZ3F964_9HELI